MSYPSTLRYTKDHEWAKLDGSIVTVGITQHAQDALGDIVFVDLPEAGRQLKKGETFGVVESIKAVSDLYSPITGKVTEANSALSGETSLLNSSPHEKAWIAKIEVASPAEFNDLMSADQYTAFIESLK
ncbi:MAG: glycine cleavage system protein GcvH [Proteobacteria bacterium]|nr:MAG: glycine cleavage system protein GcvH [Pseudomonadota bacterium]